MRYSCGWAFGALLWLHQQLPTSANYYMLKNKTQKQAPPWAAPPALVGQAPCQAGRWLGQTQVSSKALGVSETSALRPGPWHHLPINLSHEKEWPPSTPGSRDGWFWAHFGPRPPKANSVLGHLFLKAGAEALAREGRQVGQSVRAKPGAEKPGRTERLAQESTAAHASRLALGTTWEQQSRCWRGKEPRPASACGGRATVPRQHRAPGGRCRQELAGFT